MTRATLFFCLILMLSREYCKHVTILIVHAEN